MTKKKSINSAALPVFCVPQPIICVLQRFFEIIQRVASVCVVPLEFLVVAVTVPVLVPVPVVVDFSKQSFCRDVRVLRGLFELL